MKNKHFIHDICPICSSEFRFIYTFYDKQKCVNDCYQHIVKYSEYYQSYSHSFLIFDKRFEYANGDGVDRIRTIEKIEELIAYWKENNRYLTELMK